MSVKLKDDELYGGGKKGSSVDTKTEDKENPNPYAPSTTPTPAPPLKDYITTTWDETAKGQAAGQAKADALAALKGQNPFAFSQAGWLEDVFKDIKNYGDFSYDMNGDALYQQYKDKYTQQGKLAMADTMGQAAALTGGYGSSYAQSVGQQAYQASLDNLNDIVPELAQMAYDRYSAGKQDLYNQYGLLSDQYNREYGEWNDEYGRLMDAYNVANSDYYDGANLHNSEVANKNSVIGRENDEAWKQTEWGEGLRQADIAQDNWEKQFGLSERELAMKEEAWEIEKQMAGITDPAEELGEPSEIAKKFIDDLMPRDKYLASGKTAKEYDEYVTNTLDSFLRDGRIEQSDYDYLKKYYNQEKTQAEAEHQQYLQNVVEVMKGYTTERGQADYLASMGIPMDEALQILAQYGTKDVTNRTWEVINGGGIDFLNLGINANAVVRDQFGNEYSLADLRKELKSKHNMSNKAANDWIKENIEKPLGIK